MPPTSSARESQDIDPLPATSERYAGEVPEWAVFHPEDRNHLVAYDANVRHSEGIASDGDLFSLGSREVPDGFGAHLDPSA